MTLLKRAGHEAGGTGRQPTTLKRHIITINQERHQDSMGRFLYPVDTDQFQEIREQGRVYVDKTDMVFDLVSRYKYVFLQDRGDSGNPCSATRSRRISRDRGNSSGD